MIARTETTVKHLYALYDGECGLCQRCRQWFERQSTLVDLDFVPLQTSDLVSRFPGIAGLDLGDQLVVVSDTGGIYRGSEAWIMCLYALREYRGWARRLSHPMLYPLARRVCELAAANRLEISRWLFEISPEEAGSRMAAEPGDSCRSGGGCDA